MAIEAWYEKDDTMGHRKLGALLHMGKNRVKRVMKKYDIAARRKRKKYVYPGKASSIVPNLLRGEKEELIQEEVVELAEIVFSDIFEVKLADATKVRGCFALWKQTRHILAIAFETHMRADLVVSTIDLIQQVIPGTIFHSDQGSQYGAAQTRVSSTYFHRHPMMGLYGGQNHSRNGSKNHFFCLAIGAPFSHHLGRRSQGQKRMRPLTSSVKMVSCSPPMPHLPGSKSDSVQ